MNVIPLNFYLPKALYYRAQRPGYCRNCGDKIIFSRAPYSVSRFDYGGETLTHLYESRTCGACEKCLDEIANKLASLPVRAPLPEFRRYEMLGKDSEDHIATITYIDENL